MLRSTWFTSASAAKKYFAMADYLADSPGDWLGEGARRLGLEGPATHEDFAALCDNLHPRTGEKLRPRAKAGDRVGMDLTFNSTKSVGLARELGGPDNQGDERVQEAHREAVAYTMKLVEREVQARVRAGGENGNRHTRSLVACRFTHRDTRINADDYRPDMSLHDHAFVLNTTWDPVERKWKAAELGDVKRMAPYFEACYHNRLAGNLKALGYGVRRKGKAFEVEGVSDALVAKFSRRRAYILKVADKLGITSGKGMGTLGATTRLGKTKETEANLHGYYVSRLTDTEKQLLQTLEGRPGYETDAASAVRYAIPHEFERKSVLPEYRLHETAIRHGIGSVTPEQVAEEMRRQGVIVKDGMASTWAVLEEERKVIQFARDGRGTCRPMSARLGSQVDAGAPLARSSSGCSGLAWGR